MAVPAPSKSPPTIPSERSLAREPPRTSPVQARTQLPPLQLHSNSGPPRSASGDPMDIYGRQSASEFSPLVSLSRPPDGYAPSFFPQYSNHPNSYSRIPRGGPPPYQYTDNRRPMYDDMNPYSHPPHQHSSASPLDLFSFMPGSNRNGAPAGMEWPGVLKFPLPVYSHIDKHLSHCWKSQSI